MNEIILNILTRTSNRPRGFMENRKSIHNSIGLQPHWNINHIIITDDKKSINYINDDCFYVKRKQYPSTIKPDPGYRWSPFNLYFNKIKKYIKNGWVLHLDDDDKFFDENSLRKMFELIEQNDEDTMLFHQMEFSNGNRLPYDNWEGKPIENEIGGSCFLFNVKWLDYYEWDEWSVSDFRVINKLYEVIPNKKFLREPLIYVGQQGLGERNDI